MKTESILKEDDWIHLRTVLDMIVKENRFANFTEENDDVEALNDLPDYEFRFVVECARLDEFLSNPNTDTTLFLEPITPKRINAYRRKWNISSERAEVLLSIIALPE